MITFLLCIIGALVVPTAAVELALHVADKRGGK